MSRVPLPAGQPDPPPTARFAIGRFCDNELILFDERAEESWIVYPPRSAYSFLAARRETASVALVEHHPWAPHLPPRDHPIRPRDACLAHGLSCAAQRAIQAAVDIGYDPFT